MNKGVATTSSEAHFVMSRGVPIYTANTSSAIIWGLYRTDHSHKPNLRTRWALFLSRLGIGLRKCATSAELFKELDR